MSVYIPDVKGTRNNNLYIEFDPYNNYLWGAGTYPWSLTSPWTFI